MQEAPRNSLIMGCVQYEHHTSSMAVRHDTQPELLWQSNSFAFENKFYEDPSMVQS
jgi:hypothetical protein